MIIIIGLALLVPALIGLLCYEKFRGIELGMIKRIEIYLVFAFLVNLSGYAVLWLRGNPRISWALDNESTAMLTGFVTQYMLLTLVVAVVLAYVLSLVRISKSKVDENEHNEPGAEPVETDSAVQKTTNTEK